MKKDGRMLLRATVFNYNVCNAQCMYAIRPANTDLYKTAVCFFIKPVYCQPQEVNIKFDTMFNNS